MLLEAAALHERLAEEIGGRRRRVRLAEIWEAFLRAEPTLAAASERRLRLAETIEALAREGRCELPSSRSYDRTEQPPLPRFIVFGEDQPESPRRAATRTARNFPWRPELAFVGSLRSVSPDELRLLIRVNRFLADRASHATVPYQERSLELFGDEKFIERFLRGRLFVPSRLSLQLLAAELAPPPLAVRRVSKAPRALVVENAAAFHTFAQLLRGTSEIGVLAYGGGLTFIHSVASLRDYAPILEILYFGDLDVAGLHIPAEAGKTARYLAGLPDVVPAGGLYRLLFSNGHVAEGSERCSQSRATALASWLPNDLRLAAAGLLRDQRRIAQEAVGYELLSTAGDWRDDLASSAHALPRP